MQCLSLGGPGRCRRSWESCRHSRVAPVPSIASVTPLAVRNCPGRRRVCFVESLRRGRRWRRWQRATCTRGRGEHRRGDGIVTHPGRRRRGGSSYLGRERHKVGSPWQVLRRRPTLCGGGRVAPHTECGLHRGPASVRPLKTRSRHDIAIPHGHAFPRIAQSDGLGGPKFEKHLRKLFEREPG